MREYDVPVAPSTGTPARSHSTDTAASAGANVPGSTVRVCPSRGSPDSRGVGVAVIVPGTTGPVAVDVAGTSTYPLLDAVTTTAIVLPTWSGPGVKVVAVAPSTGSPSAVHW